MTELASGLEQRDAPPTAAPATVPRRGADVARRRPPPWLVPFLIALVAYGAAYLVADPEVDSDEPSYLLYAHSLAFDADADLRDDHADGEAVDRYYRSPDLGPHAYEYRDDGRWRSVHGVGLPLLLAPVLAVGGGVGEVRWLFVVAQAVLAASAFGLLGQLGVDAAHRRGWRWAAWAAACFSLPLLGLAGQVFPEVIGALCVVTGLRAALRLSPSPARLAIAGGAVAALPWLHVRYGVLALGLGLALLWRARRSASRAATVAVVVPLALSAMLLPLLFFHWYGSPLPTAPYDPRPDIPFFDQLRPVWTWPTLYRYTASSVLSPSVGLLPFAPVLWLGLVGSVVLARRRGVAAALALVVVATYLFALGGLDPDRNAQGRFLAVLAPLLAVPLLEALSARRALRVAFAGLALLSAALAVEGLRTPERLAGTNSGRTTLRLADQLSIAWPVLIDRSLPFLAARPDATAEAGRVVDGIATAEPGDQPGTVIRIRPIPVAPGRYVARFAVEGSGPAARVSVRSGEVVLAERDLVFDDTSDVATPVELDIALTATTALSAEVTYLGAGTLRAALVSVSPAADPALPSGVQARFPSWPLTLLWAGGTLFVGALAAEDPGVDRNRAANR